MLPLSTLHWLAGYSPIRLMTIAFGLVGIVGNVIRMLPNLDDKNRFPVPYGLVGIAFCGCLLVSTLIRGQPPWEKLGDGVGMASVVLGIPYVIMMMRRGRRKSVVAAPITPVQSDTIWPPPPTLPGGG